MVDLGLQIVEIRKHVDLLSNALTGVTLDLPSHGLVEFLAFPQTGERVAAIVRSMLSAIVIEDVSFQERGLPDLVHEGASMVIQIVVSTACSADQMVARLFHHALHERNDDRM